MPLSACGCRFRPSGYSAKNGRAQGKRMWQRRVLDLHRAPLEAGWSSLVWLAFCAWFIWTQMDRHPLVQPWRYRRQYADDAGPRPARTARTGSTFANIGSTRPMAPNIHWSRLVDLPLAGLILVLAAVPRRGRRGALGGRDRAAAAAICCCCSSLALTARRLIDPRAYPLAVPRLVLRRLDQRHVHAGPDRPPRLAVGVAGAQRRRRSPIPSARAAG